MTTIFDSQSSDNETRFLVVYAYTGFMTKRQMIVEARSETAAKEIARSVEGRCIDIYSVSAMSQSEYKAGRV